jgi:D-glucosaminate-6-phosphate ammonia-lyase
MSRRSRQGASGRPRVTVAGAPCRTTATAGRSLNTSASRPSEATAASEYDLTGFLAAGAALAIYSAHKFLDGPTVGLVAGRKDLVRAAFLQNAGIGRGMKVGKESILGAMVALGAWETRDHAAVRARERGTLELWLDRLRGLPGLTTRVVPDPTDNPLDWLELSVDPRQAGTTASTLAAVLAGGDPPVIVRDHEVANGHLFLDLCNLHPGEAEVVADRIADALRRLRDEPCEPPGDLERRRFEALTRWPD